MRALQPVEVLHDGRWLAATLMATRRDADGWRGLVGYVDSLTGKGVCPWRPKTICAQHPNRPSPSLRLGEHRAHRPADDSVRQTRQAVVAVGLA